MMDRSLVEGHPSKNLKRLHECDVGEEASPPKIITPRMRSRAEVTPKTSSKEDDTTPRTRSRAKNFTPKVEGRADKTMPRTRSKVEVTPRLGSKVDLTPKSRGKVEMTPKSRSKGKETTPRANRRAVEHTPISSSSQPTPRSSRCRKAESISETPTQFLKVPQDENLLNSPKPSTRSKRCRSISPAVSKSQILRRSRSNTPVITRDHASKTRSSKSSGIPVLSDVRNTSCAKGTDFSKAKVSEVVCNTQLVKKSPSKENRNVKEAPSRTSESRLRHSPKSQQTPKGPPVTVIPRSQILDQATPDDSVRVPRRSTRRSSSLQNTVDSDVQTDNKMKVCLTAEDGTGVSNTSKDGKKCYEQHSSDLDLEVGCSQNCSENTSSTETDGRDCTDELKKEVEKAKKRRSTFGKRKSGLSFGGRKSLSAALPMLSLEGE